MRADTPRVAPDTPRAAPAPAPAALRPRRAFVTPPAPLLEARITAPGKVAVAPQAPLAAAPARGAVIVEVDCVSLCGSDLALFAGKYGGPRRDGLRFGHEWAGRVVATAPGSSFAVGQRVTGDCAAWCGSCDGCAFDRNLCRRLEKYGITIDGFAARRCEVSERHLYHDPYDLPPRLLALAEITAVAWRGVARGLAVGALRAASTVGAGALGVLTALVLHHHHGCAVRLIERDAGRVALVRERFPELTVEVPGDPSGAAPAQRAAGGTSWSALYRGDGAPLVFECAGSVAGFDAALAIATPGGTVVTFGLPGPGVVDVRLVAAKRLAVFGSIGGTGAFPQALAFLARHRETVTRLITHRFPLPRAEEAFRCAASDPERLKVQLTWREAAAAAAPERTGGEAR